MLDYDFFQTVYGEINFSRAENAMARIPLIEPEDQVTLKDLVAQIRNQRGGSVLNIYKALLHSPPLAESWFKHINTVRWGTGLDGRLREIVIIRLGHLTGSAYILRQHVPSLAAAEGLGLEECDALGDWRDTGHFSARERAALDFADAMTESIQVPDAVFEPLRDHFSPRAIVELAVLVGSYNMHSRVLQALDVDLEPD
ncbi:MAG: carboxymuconolactone decarboxylase family protein [Alphaproteobacteria bacterium]